MTEHPRAGSVDIEDVEKRLAQTCAKRSKKKRSPSKAAPQTTLAQTCARAPTKKRSLSRRRASTVDLADLETERRGGDRGNQYTGGKKETVSALPTRDAIANALGETGRTVQKTITVKKKAPGKGATVALISTKAELDQ